MQLTLSLLAAIVLACSGSHFILAQTMYSLDRQFETPAEPEHSRSEATSSEAHRFHRAEVGSPRPSLLMERLNGNKGKQGASSSWRNPRTREYNEAKSKAKLKALMPTATSEHHISSSDHFPDDVLYDPRFKEVEPHKTLEDLTKNCIDATEQEVERQFYQRKKSGHPMPIGEAMTLYRKIAEDRFEPLRQVMERESDYEGAVEKFLNNSEHRVQNRFQLFKAVHKPPMTLHEAMLLYRKLIKAHFGQFEFAHHVQQPAANPAWLDKLKEIEAQGTLSAAKRESEYKAHSDRRLEEHRMAMKEFGQHSNVQRYHGESSSQKGEPSSQTEHNDRTPEEEEEWVLQQLADLPLPSRSNGNKDKHV